MGDYKFQDLFSYDISFFAHFDTCSFDYCLRDNSFLLVFIFIMVIIITTILKSVDRLTGGIDQTFVPG